MNNAVKMALEDWRRINASNLQWATFEAINFESQPVVRVVYGYILDGGFKETAIGTLNYTEDEHGKVFISRS